MTGAATIPRRRVAVIALAATVLVICSPLWHHQHHHPGDPSHGARGSSPHTPRLCGTEEQGTGSFAVCPICLSQRLLAQSHAEQAQQVERPGVGSPLAGTSTSPSAITLTLDPQARSPPVA